MMSPLCFFVVSLRHLLSSSFFFFNDTAPTEIYPLPLHDALPIFARSGPSNNRSRVWLERDNNPPQFDHSNHPSRIRPGPRSEEHTSELQSQSNLVCRLLLEKKKNNKTQIMHRNNMHHNTLTPRPH